MIFQKKNRNKLIEKAWGFEQDIIIEQIFEYAQYEEHDFYNFNRQNLIIAKNPFKNYKNLTNNLSKFLSFILNLFLAKILFQKKIIREMSQI